MKNLNDLQSLTVKSIMYRVKHTWSIKIEKMEATRETEHYVRISPSRREKIKTQDHTYFDNFEDAKKYAIEVATKKYEAFLHDAQDAKSNLNDILHLDEKKVKEGKPW